MGAHSLTKILPGILTENQVQSKFNEMKENDQAEYGSNTYNGSWSTIDSLKCRTEKTFNNSDEANEFCLNNSEKWHHAIAVRFFSLKSNKDNPKLKKFDKVISEFLEKKKELQQKLQTESDSEILSFMAKEQNFVSCGDCTSKIAMAKLKERVKKGHKIICPVCDSALTSTSYQKAKKKINEKLDLIDSGIAEIVKAKQQKAVEIASKNDETEWLIAGWVAS